MMSKLRQFFADFEAADKVAMEAEEKAFLKFDEALNFLASFTLDNRGLTPECAKLLSKKLDAFYILNSAHGRAEQIKESLVFRMGAHFGVLGNDPDIATSRPTGTTH